MSDFAAIFTALCGMISIVFTAAVSYHYFRKKGKDKFSESLFRDYINIAEELADILKDLLPLSFTQSNYTKEQLDKIAKDLSLFYFKHYLLLPQKVLQEIYCLNACLYHQGKFGFIMESGKTGKPLLRRRKSTEEKMQLAKNASVFLRGEESVLKRLYNIHKDRQPDAILKCQARNVMTAVHDCWNLNNIHQWKQQLSKQTIAQLEEHEEPKNNIMKKLLIFLLSALSLTAVAQDKKTVAVLDPICRDNSVNAFYQQMVRGAMESAVTASDEYEAYDRSAFDQIQKEQTFQRTGAVSDSQIKKMGEMAGVDYVLVSEVSAYEGYLSAVIKILNVTTGKYDKSIDDYMELKPNAVKSKCNEMASSLFGSSLSNSPTNNKQIPSGYVDLGLPSKTLWKTENEAGYYTSHDVGAKFGTTLPTYTQWKELIDICIWTWNNNGYTITGNNGVSIFLPAYGCIGRDGKISGYGIDGEYWSATFETTKNNHLYRQYLLIQSDKKGIGWMDLFPPTSRSVRLVK